MDIRQKEIDNQYKACSRIKEKSVLFLSASSYQLSAMSYELYRPRLQASFVRRDVIKDICRQQDMDSNTELGTGE